MRIVKLKDNNIDDVVDLWYETSLKAHDFIPPEYWERNKIEMATKYLPNSETYLALQNDTIVGFIAMRDNYLAAIFVSSDMQGRGIGTELLQYIKNCRDLIQLKVYKKNQKSVEFYKKHDFQFISEEIEEATGEIEYFMKWEKLKMKNETKVFYDLTAERTAEEWYSNDILLVTIQDFLKLLPASPQILDFGCGPGHETKRLASSGAKVLGIDYSDECIRVAKERCPECTFMRMDFRNLDESLGPFDGIFASGSLIHLNPEELQNVIHQIPRILKKDGLLLMIIQEGEGINEKFSNLEVDGKVLRRPLYCYTKGHMIEAASKAGLEFLKEGVLDKTLYTNNWRNYLFKKD